MIADSIAQVERRRQDSLRLVEQRRADSIWKYQQYLAELERQRLDSINAWKTDSTNKAIKALEERRQYLALRKTFVATLHGGAGLYPRREFQNNYNPLVLGANSAFTGEICAFNLSWARWFNQDDSGVILQMSISTPSLFVASLNGIDTTKFDIADISQGRVDVKYSFGETGVGIIGAMGSYRHQWGRYYNIPTMKANDTNAKVYHHALGLGVFLEPALGRYGFFINGQFYPRMWSWGSNEIKTSLEGWSATIGYSFGAVILSFETFQTSRVHTELFPQFLFNIYQLRLGVHWWQTY